MEKTKFNTFLDQSKIPDELKNLLTLKSVVVTPKKEKWTFVITLKKIIDPDLLLPFIRKIKSFFYIPKIVKKVHVNIEYDDTSDFALYALTYWDHVIYELVEEKASYLVLKNFKVNYQDHYTLIVDKDSLYVSDYLEDVIEYFKRLGIVLTTIDLEVSSTIESSSKILESSIMEQDNYLIEKQKYIKKDEGPKLAERKTFAKKAKAQAMPIKEIPLDLYRLDKYKNEKGETKFLLTGMVSKAEVKKLKNTTLFSFVLADEEDAIVVKRFLRTDKDISLANEIKDGQMLQVEGNAVFDSFQKDVCIFADAFYEVPKAEKKERMDKAKDKRIEFHVHTKMSTMDAVTDAKDYVERAIKWGHKAIAFTDHNGLYAFPDIYKATKKTSIKPIYGVELDFVDAESFLITSNSKEEDILLRDANYVVFDIETTGLSASRDKIIEIGAVKISGGQVVDRYQTFVNPEMKLSDFTIDFTNITDEMVKDAPTIDIVLPQFLAFAKDAILVAHNALFDVSHIRENANRLGQPFDDSLVIDTLNLARYFYNDRLKRFNLKALAKLFKVTLDGHHRADNDALATAHIWLNMLTDLQQKNIKYYHQINESIDVNEAYKHVRPKHLNVIAKNQVGYKNMFKIVSQSLTDHFYQGPRTLKSELIKYREGILISSGCSNGDVFEAALNLGKEALSKVIQFYDIIEVQPPAAYKHLLRDLGSDGKAIIEGVIRKIIDAAKKNGKIIIASGDVHYLDQSDQVYRDMYIRTPVVGGGIHDLYNYEEKPDMHFLTTEEMLNAFGFLGQALAQEIVVTNTNKLNDSIEYVKAFPDELYSLPDDAFKEVLGVISIQEEVKHLVMENAHAIYGKEIHPIVQERIDRELKNIIENKFAPIYYISHLLVKKSLEDGYLVGSRGSVGSSLVATLLNITEVNPLRPHYRCPKGDFTVFKLTEDEVMRYGMTDEQKQMQANFNNVQSGYDLKDAYCPHCGEKLVKDGHDIPFETFLGFDGDKVPDIDLNFSGDYQAKAHQYVRELLGEDYTFRAGTISTVAERNAYGYVKGYLESLNLEKRPAQIERLAKKIEGVKRSTGQHPGGIVVVPKSKTIYDVTPIQYPADDTTSTWKTTHFDYHSFESNLLKLDILGHDDPTMIKFLMDYVNVHQDEFPFTRAQDIPLDDQKVYRLFSSTDVIGVKSEDILSEVASFGIPEFGTPFTRQMLNDTKPSTFAGLVKISGLSHGTDVWLKNAQSLVTGQSEFGRIPFADIIGCRDDIMVQLQAEGMDPLAAFNIMEFVRKGKPSKDKTTWLAYEQEMKKHQIKPWYIWSASQIKYMFPKAHATAYVIMAMRIAWFKVHKPLLFYSAFFSKRAVQFDYETMVAGANAIKNKMNDLNGQFGNKVKDEQLLVTLGVALEMTKRGFKFLPVDIELSEATTFRIEKDGIRMPFVSIDGLGDAVAYDVVEKRNEKGFTSQKDVTARTRINKTVFEKMKKYGAFDQLNEENNVIDIGLFGI